MGLRQLMSLLSSGGVGVAVSLAAPHEGWGEVVKGLFPPNIPFLTEIGVMVKILWMRGSCLLRRLILVSSLWKKPNLSDEPSLSSIFNLSASRPFERPKISKQVLGLVVFFMYHCPAISKPPPKTLQAKTIIHFAETSHPAIIRYGIPHSSLISQFK